MQIFDSNDSGTFYHNSRKQIKNYVVQRIGQTNIAVYNAYDTRLQLIPSTHFSQIQVNGVIYQNQAELMDALTPLLFSKYVGSGQSLPQNNIGKVYRRITVNQSVVNSALAAHMVNTATTPLVVSEQNSPVIYELLQTDEDETYTNVYTFLFLKGKGLWGSSEAGALPVEAADFHLINSSVQTPEDVTEDPNNQINYLGVIENEDFITVANESTWQFTGDTQQYYFSYTSDDVLYFALFVGQPGVYGGGLNNDDFSPSDFVVTTNSNVTPVPVAQNLQSVLEVGNVSTQGLGLGVTGSTLPSNVGLLRIGEGINTDSYSTAAISEYKDISAGVWNGLNIEVRPTLLADLNTRMRGMKGVSIVNMNGFTLSNTGGGGLGVEGVVRTVGGGTMNVATGIYARILMDLNSSASTINSAIGVLVPQHTGALLSPIKWSNGAVLTEQGDTTRVINASNLVLGSPANIVGDMSTIYTGKWNIYSPSQFESYFKSNIQMSGTPTLNSHLVNKQYVDNKAAGYLPLSGGSLTGSLYLNGNSVNAGGYSQFGILAASQIQASGVITATQYLNVQQNNSSYKGVLAAFGLSQDRTLYFPTNYSGTVPVAFQVNNGAIVQASPSGLVSLTITGATGTGSTISGDYLPLTGGTMTGTLIGNRINNTLFYPTNASNPIDFRGWNGTVISRYFSNGNMYFGASPQDNGYKMEVAGTTKINGDLTTQNILPASDTTYNLGSSNSRFGDIWGGRVLTGGIRANSGGAGLNFRSQNNTSIAQNFNSTGNWILGTGTTDTGYKLTVEGNISAQSDVEISDINKGVVLKSPDGTRYRITVANGGTLTTTAI